MQKAYEIQGTACHRNGEALVISPVRKTCAGYCRDGSELPLYATTDAGREATPEEATEYRRIGRPVWLQTE